MEFISLPFLVTFGIFALVIWAYGQVRYMEGENSGTAKGMLLMSELAMLFFKSKKLIGSDKDGNVYRLNDLGERGETIMTPMHKFGLDKPKDLA